MNKNIWVPLIVFILLLAAIQPVSAYYREAVLGASTEDTSSLSMSPTTNGPGLILPDSPLYALDHLKQNIRLFFAITPEAKAKIYADVAGERLAEMRYMLAKNDQENARVALIGMTTNLKNASKELAKADLEGKNTKALAKTLNDDIKSKQVVLDELAQIASGETKVYVLGASTALFETKMKVEDSLDVADFQKELLEDLGRLIQQRTKESLQASQAAQQASAYLDKLTGKNNKHQQASSPAVLTSTTSAQ